MDKNAITNNKNNNALNNLWNYLCWFCKTINAIKLKKKERINQILIWYSTKCTALIFVCLSIKIPQYNNNQIHYYTNGSDEFEYRPTWDVLATTTLLFIISCKIFCVPPLKVLLWQWPNSHRWFHSFRTVYFGFPNQVIFALVVPGCCCKGSFSGNGW
jgi:hypothetical protein